MTSAGLNLRSEGEYNPGVRVIRSADDPGSTEFRPQGVGSEQRGGSSERAPLVDGTRRIRDVVNLL